METKTNFKNSKGDNLVGILTLLNEDKNSPIVIVCHGFSSNKEGSAHKVSTALNKEGLNTFRFDFWGHGESDGNFSDITISEGVDDILSAIKHLSQNNYSNIGLLGTSYGGACAIMASSKTDKLKALGLRSPVADYFERAKMIMSSKEIAEWQNKGYQVYTNSKGIELKLNYSFYDDFQNNKGFDVASSIKIPTCIVHGDKDERVPLVLSEKLSKLIPNNELHIIPGADHRYTDVVLDDQAISYLAKFFAKAML